MKTIYIASPYSHKSKKVEQERYEEITRVAALLHSKYPNIAFILPITQSHNLKKYNKALRGDFSFWKKIDLHFISRSDEVWVVNMEGAFDSVGVMEEIKFSIRNNKPIYFIDPKTLKKRGFKQYFKEEVNKA